MKKTILFLLMVVPVGIGLFLLFSYRSPLPWLFNRYSLPYAIFLGMIVSGVIFTGILFIRFKLRAVAMVVAGAVTLIFLLALVEGAIQAWILVYPTYSVLLLEPDRELGWKQVPNFRYTWTGTRKELSPEFRVPVTINSLGFRDLERAREKPEGTIRVVLLGDSLLEAIQVPFPLTAGGRLEAKLDDFFGDPGATEVLNFGVSSYGVGQNLLVWEKYASKFNPDYVIILVTDFTLSRTLKKHITVDSGKKTKKQLWVRPTFWLEGDKLVRIPSRDHEEFVRAQKDVIERSFAGSRVVRKQHFFLLEKFRGLNDWLISYQKRQQRKRSPRNNKGKPPRSWPEGMIPVNMRVLEELGRQVAEMGGRLIVVDAIRYYEPKGPPLSAAIKELCREKGFHYLLISPALFDAERKGNKITWNRDRHFNETGNEIIAESLFKRLTELLPRNRAEEKGSGSNLDY